MVRGGMEAASNINTAMDAVKFGNQTKDSAFAALKDKRDAAIASGDLPAMDAEALKKDDKLLAKQAKSLGREARNDMLKSTFGEGIKQKAYKAVTGMDMPQVDSNGKTLEIADAENKQKLKVGQEFFDGKEKRKSTYADVQRQNQKNMNTKKSKKNYNPYHPSK